MIAYNQPVSRSFIEQVRGVDSSSTVTKLLEKGLIEEAGRLDLPGRPVAFQTTDTFLRVFGLGGLKDLPPLHDEVAEDAAAGDVQGAPMADGEEQARTTGMEVSGDACSLDDPEGVAGPVGGPAFAAGGGTAASAGDLQWNTARAGSG